MEGDGGAHNLERTQQRGGNVDSVRGSKKNVVDRSNVVRGEDDDRDDDDNNHRDSADRKRLVVVAKDVYPKLLMVKVEQHWCNAISTDWPRCWWWACRGCCWYCYCW